MADRKISEMTLLAQGDLVSTTDYLPIVDPSEAVAANRNKRILGSSLVLGALSQATSVTIGGTLSETISSVVYPVASQFDVGTAPNQIPLNQYLGTLAYQDAAAVNVGLLVTSGNAGVGVTPTAWATGSRALQLKSYSAVFEDVAGRTTLGFNAYESATNVFTRIQTEAASLYRQVSGVHSWLTASSGSAGTTISFTTAMTLDAAGNLGLRVTPNAGWSASAVLQLAGGGQIAFSSSFGSLLGNAYYDGSVYKYIASSDHATRYSQGAGVHAWWTAGTGTANAAISFTQAMTLDASGNLGIGGTPGDFGAAYRNVEVAGADGGQFRARGTTNSVDGILSANSVASVLTVGARSNHPMALVANNVEVARVKASGQVRFVPLAAAPTANVQDGDVYYNSGTNKLQVRAGGVWVDLH